MIRLKCPKCGQEIAIDEESRTPFCPQCGLLIDLERDAPEKMRERRERREAFKVSLSNALTPYREQGDPKELRTIIQSREHYREIPGFSELWKDFFLKAAGISVDRKDKEIQSYLKSQAIYFDRDCNQQREGLYVALLQAYPKLGSGTDWEDLIAKTHGDDELFKAISESLICYIVKEQDKAFAMDLFGWLSVREEEWSDAGRIYLRALLSDDEVAQQVFPVSAFNARTMRFARRLRTYCNKYLDKGSRITVEETDVWKNYTEACRIRKRRQIIAMSCCCAFLLVAALGGFFFLNAIDRKTIQIDVARVIETTYGEPLDLSEYSVSYRKNSGAEVKEPITLKMLSGYDPELVGTQQTVYVEFEGAKMGITLLVKPATLPTPILTQDGNFVTWEFVANAKDYNVYVNSSSVIAGTTTALSYDLSADPSFGTISVTVRANAGSEKYSNSAMSEALTATKLCPPTGIHYEDGLLSWEKVEGADRYELHINGTPSETTTNSFKTDFRQGDNEVTIIARSSSSSVIAAVTEETISYFHLSPISSMAYRGDTISWEAEEDATMFSVYVDGEHWKDLNRPYFRLADDGFIETFGEREHTIGVECRSSVTGSEPSKIVTYRVAIGNRATVRDGALVWTAVGTGATYHVQVNGDSPISLSLPDLSLSGVQWQEGENTVSIRATLENESILLETVTFTKLGKPTLYASGGKWMTDGDQKNRYSLNNGAWEPELPETSELKAGDYTVRAKRIAASSFEIESDTVELKVRKLAAPTLSVEGGKLISNFDGSHYALRLFCMKSDGAISEISSLNEIREAGKYLIKARLTAVAGVEQEVDLIIDSDESAQIEVTKLEAPSVFYEEGDIAVTSDVSNVKFFYLDGGEEKELAGGLVSNLPKGIFTVYARRLAEGNGELDSESTPESRRVSVYNMNITLKISKLNDTQFNAVFGGCEEIEELSFTYEIRYYDREDQCIGNKKGEEPSLKKSSVSSSNIITRINYGLGVSYEQGYGKENVYRLELIVKFTGASGGQTLKAGMTL